MPEFFTPVAYEIITTHHHFTYTRIYHRQSRVSEHTHSFNSSIGAKSYTHANALPLTLQHKSLPRTRAKHRDHQREAPRVGIRNTSSKRPRRQLREQSKRSRVHANVDLQEQLFNKRHTIFINFTRPSPPKWIVARRRRHRRSAAHASMHARVWQMFLLWGWWREV